MLRVGAPAGEVARVGEALRALARADAEGFAALFDPLAPRALVAGVDAALAAPLLAFGLVDGDGEALRGRHRIRTLGERFYVLELGDGPEYVQDVWPETDALLALLERAPRGRLADVGTGSGVIAIEAAARGHTVVATDLYESALALARFNAALNGVTLELQAGHLFAPLGEREFDLVLTAPHYGRVADQLRLEVLRDGPARLAPGGTLALATQLEWEGEGALAVEPLLQAAAARGLAATVRPIEAALKRHWFERAVGEVPRLVSRHRFLVTLTRGAAPATVSVTRPAVAAQTERVHVPLARLAQSPRAAAWTVTTTDDVAALETLLAALATPELTFTAALPERLLDLCRWGAQPCVAERGQAAGAILDAGGGVRPCTHGEPLGRATDSLATLVAVQHARAADAYARRGCATCVARDLCSRCLYPVAFAGGEPAAATPRADAEQRPANGYCDFIRAHHRTLPRLRRLVATFQRLLRAGIAPPLRIARWPRRAWSAPDSDAALALAEIVGAAWNQSEAWLVEHPAGHQLFWLHEDELWDAALDVATARAGAAAADGELVHAGADLRPLAALLCR